MVLNIKKQIPFLTPQRKLDSLMRLSQIYPKDKRFQEKTLLKRLKLDV
jgi:hypothetical protein